MHAILMGVLRMHTSICMVIIMCSGRLLMFVHMRNIKR